ncbi:MAG: Rrf2 family transcriptional regulator [Bdellovibrionales bacterium]|jgi:Rrf2 family protein|nr:Rrf2 family transcriptional regulator [Bdellovibrionales bacterium]
MNRIHRKVEYALIALKHMRSKAPGERTTVKEIAAQYGCPTDVTARVLQALAGKSVLNSEQGAHGGYMIAKDLSRVSFYELLEMILGPMGVAKCLQEAQEGACDLRETCNIVSPIQLLNRKLSDFYRSLSVAELIEGGRVNRTREASRTAGTPVVEAEV